MIGNEMVRSIVFANRKGGCGKTTTAVNVAHALVNRGRQVLLVDMDPQAHTTLSLGISPDSLPASVCDLLSGDIPHDQVVLQTHVPNLFLIPSSRNLTRMEIEPASQQITETALAEHLALHVRSVDYVIIDLPPAVGMLSISALVAAREVFIPMPMHFLAMEGLAEMMRLIYMTNARWNPRLRLQGIIPTFFNKNTRIAREICLEIIRNFGEDKLMPGIRMNVSLAEAPGSGTTIFEYAPKSIGANDYDLLADRIEMMGEQSVSPIPNDKMP
jgi:chromosome partitioning protein